MSLYHKAGNSASYALDSIKSLIWENQSTPEGLMSDAKLIRLMDALNAIFHTLPDAMGELSKKDLMLPEMVVVGTQSSGKSSVLNALIGMDILPTGKQMVTRTPLRLELIKTEPDPTQKGELDPSHGLGSATTHKDGDVYAEFGDIQEGVWKSSHRVALDYPRPTPLQQQEILLSIQEITDTLAGSKKNISSSIIRLRIYSPYVTHLTFTDLPGLTAMACKDLGQPADIKSRIENLILEHIQSPKCIVLAVMAARSDLEADMGLELAKRVDPEGERTIGVLTKLDLLHDDLDVKNYLTNHVSKDLQLKKGYFAVKNRTSTDQTRLSVQDGIAMENEYFTQHKVYGNAPFKDRTGIIQLKQHLVQVLSGSIRTCLPLIKSSVAKELDSIDVKLRALGESLPNDVHEANNYIHNILARFNQKFKDTIYLRGSSLPSARNIRKNFVQTREQLKTSNPFKDLDKELQAPLDTYLGEMLENAEGNHMLMPCPQIEILEKCLQDDALRPLQRLFGPLQMCTDEIHEELKLLLSTLLDEIPLKRFQCLKELLQEGLTTHILDKNHEICLKALKRNIEIQESYIWTDKSQFLELFQKQMAAPASSNGLLHQMHGQEAKKDAPAETPKNLLIRCLKDLLANYTDHVIESLQDVGPKTIMYYLVKTSCEELYGEILRLIHGTCPLKLLQEDSSIDQERKALTQIKQQLVSAQDLLVTTWRV